MTGLDLISAIGGATNLSDLFAAHEAVDARIATLREEAAKKLASIVKLGDEVAFTQQVPGAGTNCRPHAMGSGKVVYVGSGTFGVLDMGGHYWKGPAIAFGTVNGKPIDELIAEVAA